MNTTWQFIYSDLTNANSTNQQVTGTGQVWNTKTHINPNPTKIVNTIRVWTYSTGSCTSDPFDTNAEKNDKFNLSSVSPNFTQTLSRTITDDIIWNVQACDSDGDCGFAPANFTLFLDSTSPEINITAPSSTEDYGAVGENESLNWNVSDTSLDIVGMIIMEQTLQ